VGNREERGHKLFFLAPCGAGRSFEPHSVENDGNFNTVTAYVFIIGENLKCQIGISDEAALKRRTGKETEGGRGEA
jgi:hypothetical protein